MTIRSGTSHDGQIAFSDGTSGDDEFRGQIRYNHGSNYLTFVTDATERMRIDSSGDVLFYGTIRNDNVSSALNISGGNGADSSANIILNGSSGSPANVIQFRTGTTERMRIANDGKVGIGDSTPNYELQVNDPSGTVSVVQLTNTTTGAGAGDGLLMYITGNDTIISNEEAGYMRFQTSGLERMRITSAGKVGVGTSAPEAKFSVQDASTPDIGLMYSGTSGGHKSRYLFIDKRGFINAQVSNNLQDDGSGTGAAHLEFATSHNGTLSTGMAMDRYGKVAIGDELFTQHGGLFQVVHTGGGNLSNDNLVYFETNSNDWVISTNYEDSGTHYHTAYREHGTIRGTVSGADGQNVAFTPGSDYRWKENVVDLTGTEGISLLKNLKPRKYNWIDNRLCTGKINTVNGFIAHEVEEAGIAHLVYGNGKDAVFEDGSIDGQTLDYAGMAPVLAAAIKGLIDKVETLETEVAALKAA
jgi:hypothetical protein